MEGRVFFFSLGGGGAASLFRSHLLSSPMSIHYSEMTLFMWCHIASLAMNSDYMLVQRDRIIAGQKKQKEVMR